MWGDYGRLCQSKRLLSDFFAISNDFVVACGRFFIFGSVIVHGCFVSAIY